MEDAVKVISAKFDLSLEVLQKIGNDSTDISSWLTVLGAYVLDNDNKQEEQKSNEVSLRKQRLNAEHQLSQLEKQLISCNTKLSKFEKNLIVTKTKLAKSEEIITETDRKYEETLEIKRQVTYENEKLKQKYAYLEEEKVDFSEIIEKKNKEIDRLNEEWKDISTKLADSNKLRSELKYNLDEIKNSDIRKEFKEKRLEQEKNMLLRQIEQISADLRTKTDSANEQRKDKTEKLLNLEAKYESLQQENLQFKLNIDRLKKTCSEQESKIELLMTKIKRSSEEHVEVENNIQQELFSQTRLVQLYKDDRDHAKQKLEELTTAIAELQNILQQVTEEKSILEAKLQVEEETNTKKINELTLKLNEQTLELDNANDLLQLSKRKGNNVGSDDLSLLSPMAAATSKILKKGMTLTQIYSEYVKVSDELLSEKDENARLKLYMEQILTEVEEKAPLLMQQRDDYEHARRTVDNMSVKLQENIKECHRLQNEHGEYERKVNFHKREERRLKALCVDLSQQVRVLLKEVEEARGGVVSSSETLPGLAATGEDLNTSSSGQVISEHLVTFKSIEDLQAQNERLLLTVRELSEEQEKLEQEGGPEIIQELKKKIENAKNDLESLKDNQKTQDDMMEKLCRQRDMYKVLCQKGGVLVGDKSIGSHSTLASQSGFDTETELTKARAELDNTINDHSKLQEESAKKERTLNETISKHEGELSTLRLERDRLKNQLDFADEKHSILKTTADGYKREAQALEQKCKSITDALNKVRVEAEKYKQEYHEAKEKLVAAEVNVKSSETEKHLIKEAEKRLMQENQSLLDQQRSQNVLLTNLQTIQNNLERQEFETRKTFGKQVDTLQREVRALRRQNDNDMNTLKTTNTILEKESKELKIKLAVELEKSKLNVGHVENSKHQIEQLESKCKELKALSEASENRLNEILQSEGDQGKTNYEHELERFKTKLREMELVVSNASSEKKAVEDQLEISKKHLQQYQEIANTNEQAITIVNEKLDTHTKDYEKKLSEANDMVKSVKSQIGAVVAEKIHLRKSLDQSERQYQSTIADLRSQAAPLERRFQEVTRALVNAKEMETSALAESQKQVKIATEATDKYERELVLHAKDVEKLTLLKEELQVVSSRYGGMEERLSEMKQTLLNNENLMRQMKEHHSKELRKGELARKDLIDQNAILHGQVERLSAQLASAKSQNRVEDGDGASADKTVEEVYELMRFVRREKEIAETKAEASETESMRYRQRTEHLLRDLDETKAALELELDRTKGRMLTEEEHKEIMEKVKKTKEYEELNKNLEKQKNDGLSQLRILREKVKKLESDLKPLQENKKALENEKSSWLAEKTALKAEIERWTSRTNQLMAQNVKTDNEDLKKLQGIKTQNEKTITALQDDLKRTKQQVDILRREALKLKGEKTENQNKVLSLQNDLVASQTTANKPTTKIDNEQMTALQKEQDELKKAIESKTSELTEKSKIIQQLKKLARKYKGQSDKLQNLLKENNIDYSVIANAPPPAAEPEATSSQASASTDSEERKKLEALVAEKDKVLEELRKELNELQTKYDTDNNTQTENVVKFQETQNRYVESEKKVLDMTKELEKLKSEVNDEKDKQEKNKKLFKTAKDKINSLSKMKESKSREVENQTKVIADLQKQLFQSNSAQNSFNEVKQEFEIKILALEHQVEELLAEKRNLTSKVEELQQQMEKIQEEKRVTEKIMKVASQQKSRLQSSSRSSIEISTTTSEAIAASPLTATVHPTATPSQTSSKFHPQTTPTASIRPLAHTAPTAMISPNVPITQTSTAPTPVASVSALPISAITPQIAEVQGRSSRPLRPGTSFKTPVARVSVQVQEMVEETANVVPSLNDRPIADQQQPGPSDETQNTTAKRSHTHIEEEQEDIDLLDDASTEEPGSKRQRVDVVPQENQEQEDSQETLEEDELLGEVTEDGDDDVMDSESQTLQGSSNMMTREANLQMERSLQPSPQELLRQRSHPRGRSQLPSFSLMPGQGSGGFYEDTDDSTVPSTPTLFMPKRTDGFAEAVSSPLVRFPTFSFSSNEQPTGATPALEQTEIHLDETRVDLMGSEDHVPQTPLSIVPSVSTAELTTTQTSQEESVPQIRNVEGQFFSEDNGQEQNVPQQIDLTEDDDDVEDDGDDADEDVEDNDPTEDEDAIDEEYEIEEAVGMFSQEDEDEESESDESDSSETSESVEQVEDDGDNEGDDVGDDDIVEINAEESMDSEFAEEEEQEEKVEEVEQADEAISVEEEKVIQEDVDPTDVSITQASDASIEIPSEQASSSTTQDEPTQDTKIDDGDKSKPVRLQRSTRGIRPILRRTAVPGRLNKPAESAEKPT